MKRKAFTLIELLMVVAVIAILAALSVPNFLEAQVRSKVALVRTDMAAVRMALRSYSADYNCYPANNAHLQAFVRAAAAVEIPNATTTPTPDDAPYSWTEDEPGLATRGGNTALKDRRFGLYQPYAPATLGAFPVLHTAGFDLSVLTTPIAYASASLPVDPFHDSRTAPYLYIHTADLDTGSNDEALTISRTQKQQYLLLSYGPDTDSEKPHFPNPVTGPFVPYDPTNGTVSIGELLVTGATGR